MPLSSSFAAVVKHMNTDFHPLLMFPTLPSTICDMQRMTSSRTRALGRLPHDDDERPKEIVLERVVRELAAVEKLHRELSQGVDDVHRHLEVCGGIRTW